MSMFYTYRKGNEQLWLRHIPASIDADSENQHKNPNAVP